MTRGAPSLSGWFWRFTWPDGRAAIVLCGVCPGWALVGVAQEPGEWRSTILDDPVDDGSGVRIGTAFAGDAEHVRCDGVEAHLHDVVPWPRPWHGTGPFGHLPFLRQYWRPLVLRARAEGAVGDWDLDGATAYVERNWGAGFPPVWWWGEAHDFGGDPVTVAFAGGPALGPLQATAVVVSVDGRLVRRGEPLLAAVRAEIAPGRWRLRGRGVEIEAEADPQAAHVLDVPVPHERRTLPWSDQHLAGRLRVRVTRRGRLLYEGESALAGLEQGEGAVIDWIKRRWAARGAMPEALRSELEAEGLELLEEQIEGRVTYRSYIVAGQRPTTGDQPTIASLALTAKRLVIRGTQGVQLDAPPGPVSSAVTEDGELLLTYAAEDLYTTRSGSVEMLLRTPRAADIHATLQAWTERSAS